mmetsp:Transcript_13995/g.16936  ORF Transcript_13995/g.16936 Transcript_13995/m.16936 type:complete len:391 (-) Transcript_13995:1022-2194(-)|eukprot:CAMPEP_0197853462 /NCGR_PEP_ID=MMETSP1438-20131217/22772_1 /TAXON_ID=1461541 /ORGANISM="Pterosperma sp., Strain CCMP1384" /LENGTH=390 /DNA_ID=CAMNT_0043467879 /DNA_START=112 /DNA_END=1284 /DNA_ORIENTATION=-
MSQCYRPTFQPALISAERSKISSVHQHSCPPPLSIKKCTRSFSQIGAKRATTYGNTVYLRASQGTTAAGRKQILTVQVATPENRDENRDEVLEADASVLLPPLESESLATPAEWENPLKGLVTTTGLRRTPLSGGVQSATDTYDLPPPAVAVRNLVEQARYAHLCTTMARMHHRRAGYPFGSLVDFAVDSRGHPIFCFTPLAIHTRNVAADPRCSMVVQMPGWTGLANARVTIFGDLLPVAEDKQHLAQDLFKHKHASNVYNHGNFKYYYMDCISDIYFVGGFGTVQWIDVNEYHSMEPDPINQSTPDQSPEQILSALNKRYSKRLCELLSEDGGAVTECQLVSIDKRGVDVRVDLEETQHVLRLRFQKHVTSLIDAHREMEAITGIPPL